MNNISYISPSLGNAIGGGVDLEFFEPGLWDSDKHPPKAHALRGGGGVSMRISESVAGGDFGPLEGPLSPHYRT